MNNPFSFLEVKGEWSLSKITNIITTKNLHLDIDLSSKYYVLSKDNEQIRNVVTNENEFFGFKKNPKTWSETDSEVVNIHNLLVIQLNSIINQEAFLYPSPKTFHYPKFSTLRLLSINEFTLELDFELGLL